MAESNDNPSKFKASNCDSWKVYEIGQCACTKTAFMGEHDFRRYNYITYSVQDKTT